MRADIDHPNVLSGLLTKRAEIAQMMEVAQVDLTRLAAELEAIEITIRVFAPECDLPIIKARLPAPHHPAWKGEITRAIFDGLRTADEPPNARDLALVMMARRKLNQDDKKLVNLMRKRVQHCLDAQRRRGLVRSIQTPGHMLRWELV